MKKALRITQNYLLIGLVPVVGTMLWGTLQPEKNTIRSGPLLSFWNILSWNLLAWFAVLILFLVALIFVPVLRESTVARLANLKERDEREEQITGQAARTSFIASMSLTLFLLFFSMFTLKITRNPAEQVAQGKNGMITVGLQFGLIDSPKKEAASDQLPAFESRDIPLSKSGLLLLLLVWQIASFRLRARKMAAAD